MKVPQRCLILIYFTIFVGDFCADGFRPDPLRYINNKNVILENRVNDMLGYMDRQVDPCEDFTQYACGNFANYYNFSTIQGYFKAVQLMHNNKEEEVNKIIENIEKYSNNHSVKLLKTFIKSCMDIDHINKLGNEPLFKLLHPLGGFPLLDKSWEETNFKLEKALSYVSILNGNTFLRYSYFYNTSNKIAIIENPHFEFLNLQDYTDEKFSDRLKAYEIFIKESLKILGAVDEEIENVTHQIIELEKKVAKFIEDKGLTLMDIYFKKTLRELKEEYPKFDWEQYFEEDFLLSFDDNKEVVFLVTDLNEIYEILVNTDKRVMANYLNWVIMYGSMEFSGDIYKEPYEKLTKYLHGHSLFYPLVTKCGDYSTDLFDKVVSSVYVKNKFGGESKEKITKLLNNLLSVLKENVKSYNWLDETTKEEALKKINKMKLKVGYPDFILNQTALNDYYKGLELEEGQFLTNIIKTMIFKRTKSILKLMNGNADEEWQVEPTEINAGYIANQNEVQAAAAFLQTPTFDKQFSDSLNYGAAGTSIGHEIIHAFDAEGRYHDEDGNIRNWWSKTAEDYFLKEEKCFIEHYNGLSVFNVSVDGYNTRKENIADAGGLNLAYQAFKNILKTQEEKPIPKFEFLSPEKLFFLSYAQLYCAAYDPTFVEGYNIAGDDHTIEILRAKGALQNHDEFAKVFQCPAGSKMNPNKKCKIW